VVGVHDGPGEAAAGPLGRRHSVDDQLGADVVGQRPAGQTTRGKIDDRGQM
jgi:hypothetical protein